MTAIPPLALLPVSPSSAASAYANVESGGTIPAGDPAGFSGALKRAMEGAINAGHQADAQALEAVGGQGNLTDVVTAVSKAELALQTTVAIRDRVVQAYQDIMRMPI